MEDEVRNGRNKWRFVLPCCCVGALLIAAVIGCGIYALWLWFLPNLGEPQRPDVAYISMLTSLRFPSSAKLVNSRYDKSMSPGGNLRAVVGIDRADVEPFVGSLSLKRPISRDDRSEITRRKNYSLAPWWNPDSAHEFLAADVDEDAVHSALKLLVGLDDPRRAVIYIMFVN